VWVPHTLRAYRQVIKVRRTMASKVLPSMARKVRPEAERAGTHYEAGEAFSGLFAASNVLDMFLGVGY